MSLKSVDYIVTAEHYSKREGADGTVRGRILKMREKFHKMHGAIITIKDIDTPINKPVLARIWQGQWIADCECGGAEFVNPNEPIFFCFGCMNRKYDGSVRIVKFPPTSEREEIERMILERPVDDQRGLTDLERVGLAVPVLYQDFPDGTTKGLSRNWESHETVAEIRKQNKLVDDWKKDLSNSKKRGKKGVK